MKGGSGKSTLASCLAVHWHLTGRAPTIIDADPQRSIARLALRERALGGVPVVEDSTAEAWKTAFTPAKGMRNFYPHDRDGEWPEVAWNRRGFRDCA